MVQSGNLSIDNRKLWIGVGVVEESLPEPPADPEPAPDPIPNSTPAPAEPAKLTQDPLEQLGRMKINRLQPNELNVVSYFARTNQTCMNIEELARNAFGAFVSVGRVVDIINAINVQLIVQKSPIQLHVRTLKNSNHTKIVEVIAD